MFHITEKVAVGLNKRFNLDRDFILCAEENLDGRYPDMGKHKNLEECVDTMGGNIESVFYSLYESGQNAQNGSALFVSHKEFAYVLSIYLKSILEKPVIDSAYLIYKLYLEGQQLLPFSNSGDFANYLDPLKDFSPMSKDEFKEQWDKAKETSYFLKLGKKEVPIQMLLCEFLSDPKSKYAPHFLMKYEKRRWEEWVDILQDTAGEILNAAPALGRIFKQVKVNEHGTILEQLERHPKTKWIIDYYNNGWDPSYCKSQFSADFFKEIFNDIYGHYASKETGMDRIVDLISMPVDKAFRDDISSGFKSDFLMNNDDALFFSYIYRLKLEGRMDLIQNFRLKDGSV